MGEKILGIWYKEIFFLFVRGGYNCVIVCWKKFINIRKLLEIISLKLFFKLWKEIVRVLLRLKGFCYFFVNLNEIFLNINFWNYGWFLLNFDGTGRVVEGFRRRS